MVIEECTTDDSLNLGVMFGIGRSRWAFLAQLSFLAVNGLGLILGSVYNRKAPNLYEHTIHNGVGWVATLLILARCIMEGIKDHGLQGEGSETSVKEQMAFLPVPSEALEEQHLIGQYRYSHDSGQGTEPASRDHSMNSSRRSEDKPQELEERKGESEPDFTVDDRSFRNFSARRLFLYALPYLPNQFSRIMVRCNVVLDWLILPLGFIVVTSGIVTYGGAFVRFHILPEVAIRSS